MEDVRLMERRYPEVGFEERMATVEFRVSPRAHIVVNRDSCRGCSTKACVTACPAGLFVTTADGGVVFNYEQCFECGTCYLVCDIEGAISWSYPDGGCGVVYARG
jgi:ferredoxin like protein